MDREVETEVVENVVGFFYGDNLILATWDVRPERFFDASG